jgi:hypothetical protein
VHWRNEAIAPTVHRLDKPGRPRLIAQHLAEMPDGDLEHGLTYHGFRPDRFKQGGFGHELPGLCHQTAEHRKGFRVQRDHLLATPQPCLALVQAKGVEHPAVQFLSP